MATDRTRTRPRQEVITAQRATVQSLERQAEQIAVDIAKSTLRAPFDGVVARRLVDEGRVVGAGQAILRLLERGTLQVRVGVPAALIDNLTQQSDLRIRNGDGNWPARLINVLPDRDPITRTRMALATDSDLLNPGDLVMLGIGTTVEERGLAVPVTALREGERGMWHCLIAEPADDGDYLLRSRSVFVLHTDGNTAIVRGAINDGERVVTAGLNRVTRHAGTTGGCGVESVSQIFYRNAHLLFLTVVVLLAGGASAMFNLPRQEDPRLTNRFPFVLTTWPGASAERIEALVTEPLEDAIREIAEVGVIEADSRPGISSINIELADHVTNVEEVERAACATKLMCCCLMAATMLFED